MDSQVAGSLCCMASVSLLDRRMHCDIHNADLLVLMAKLHDVCMLISVMGYHNEDKYAFPANGFAHAS